MRLNVTIYSLCDMGENAAANTTAGHRMPTISEFFGITIMMFYEDHDPPHFHARHARFKAKFAIADLTVLSSKGDLTGRDIGRIREWASVNQATVLENWFRCCRGESVRKIEGLR
jgi:hypothetical protein